MMIAVAPMKPFFLLVAFLTGTSSAFAVVQPGSAISVTPTTTTTTPSTTSSSALWMSGGGAAPPAPPAGAVPELKPPPAMYQAAVAAGVAKCTQSWSTIFQLGMVAGAHIGFGSYLAVSIGAACPGLAATNPGLQKLIFGSVGLPFGLIMVLATGGQLFTGNTAVGYAAYREGKITGSDLAKNWIASYGGNFVGSLVLAFLAHHSNTLAGAPAAIAVATGKCALSFPTAFVRGILCNWLVCMAVYMAGGCSSMVGKMTAVFFPISAFVSLGLDHSVANMFLIPLGMMRGAEITIGTFLLKNLLPVTLGNIVGGTLGCMTPYGSVFGNWGNKDNKQE
mmetsp:Transcript_11025/g.12431  ORF Transcript_11025/g.12431 Transcript_11025/m.12431 type:complete len:336 (+) Transcript_11025:130-1137(+)